MNNNTKIKLIERTILDDVKKPQLSAREKADLIKDYRELTNKTYSDMEKHLGLSAGCISQYIQLTSTDYNTVNEMRTKENIGKFNFYNAINQIYLYTSKEKDIPLTRLQKERIKVLILRFRKILDEGDM